MIIYYFQNDGSFLHFTKKSQAKQEAQELANTLNEPVEIRCMQVSVDAETVLNILNGGGYAANLASLATVHPEKE